MAQRTDLGKSSIGMAPNLAAALSYLLGVITGIIFYVLEKENKFIRFHAMQSILFCGVWIVMDVALAIVPVIGWMMAGVVNVIGMVLWLVVIFKAFSGEQFKIPVIGDLAEKNI